MIYPKPAENPRKSTSNFPIFLSIDFPLSCAAMAGGEKLYKGDGRDGRRGCGNS